MFKKIWLKLFNKKPQNRINYWKNFINQSIHKSKKQTTKKWDSYLQRPMYISQMFEEIANEMSDKLGRPVEIKTIQEIEKKAQGKIDYLHQFALHCYIHENKNFVKHKDSYDH